MLSSRPNIEHSLPERPAVGDQFRYEPHHICASHLLTQTNGRAAFLPVVSLRALYRVTVGLFAACQESVMFEIPFRRPETSRLDPRECQALAHSPAIGAMVAGPKPACRPSGIASVAAAYVRIARRRGTSKGPGPPTGKDGTPQRPRGGPSSFEGPAGAPRRAGGPRGPRELALVEPEKNGRARLSQAEYSIDISRV